ncbi:MAG: hypothetical protein ACR2NV_11800, partial [Thermoleophilaceae bacterium]
YTRRVPTSRPRHTITESDELARALDDAARRWPDQAGARSRLLLKLLAEGHRAIREGQEGEAATRRAAVERTSGALTGVYPTGYLAELRAEWPE